MAFKLSKLLSLRLEKLGMTADDIEARIEVLKKQSIAFISMRLGDITLTEEQKEILSENYIQYQLFAQVELESFTQDKRIFLDNLIDDIIRQSKYKREEEKEKRAGKSRIKVF